MIERYSREEMEKIWSNENKFQKWLDVEIAACEAHVKLGNIPKEALTVIKKNAAFTVNRINEIEQTTNHDVIAFLTNVAENVGSESRFIHLGLTSSDVVDTAFSSLIKDSSQILQKDIQNLLKSFKKQAKKHKNTIMMGRTHGVHAEPMTLGLKFALWYDEFKRHYNRLKQITEESCIGKISGAVGTYANIDPEIENYVCKKIGLKPAKISTQIIQRDHHASFMSVLALIGGSLEKIATEIRGLQKTECNEVEEGFKKGQKGSSAMPHKRNPITCERITGLARIIRANMMVSMENIALWHERDISHSSTERLIFPDSTILLNYMLNLMKQVIDNLIVHKEQMLKNINLLNGVIFSGQTLLALVEKGITREEAYTIVQSNAMKARDENINFLGLLKIDPRVNQIMDTNELDPLFDPNTHLKNIDMIYDKIFS